LVGPAVPLVCRTPNHHDLIFANDNYSVRSAIWSYVMWNW